PLSATPPTPSTTPTSRSFSATPAKPNATCPAVRENESVSKRPAREDPAPRAPARSPVAGARRPRYSATATSAVGRRGAHTRNQIKAHAAALFSANGYHAISVEAIARAVGGSRATIYQYFTS